jgi:hypothetical protein
MPVEGARRGKVAEKVRAPRQKTVAVIVIRKRGEKIVRRKGREHLAAVPHSVKKSKRESK